MTSSEFTAPVNPRRSLSKLLLIGLFVLLTAGIGVAATGGWLFGGVITNPDQADPVDVEVCNGPTTVRTTFQFTETGDATVDLTLPTGLTYVAGSVTTLSSPAGLTVTETSADPENPQFSIPGAANGNTIQISYEVEANCASTPGGVDIDVSLTINTTSTGIVSLDVLTADLSVSGHPAVNAEFGETVTVPVSVTNGGLGSVEPWTFFIIEIGGETQTLTVAGTATVIPQERSNGDTVFYTIDEAVLTAAGLGTDFDNTETINFVRELTIFSCDNQFTDVYGAIFGCPGVCQDPPPTGIGTFNVTLDEPELDVTTNVIQRATYCDNYIYEVTFENLGSTIPAQSTMTDLEIIVSNVFGNRVDLWTAPELTLISVDLITPGGATIALPFTGGDVSPAVAELEDLTTDPDGAGGLDDLDGDLAFDDLPSGESLTVRLEIEYDGGDCERFNNGRINTWLRYDTPCFDNFIFPVAGVSGGYRNAIGTNTPSFSSIVFDGGTIQHTQGLTGRTTEFFFACYNGLPNVNTPNFAAPLDIYYLLPDGVMWDGNDITYGGRAFPTRLSANGDTLIAENTWSFGPQAALRDIVTGFVGDCSALPAGTGRVQLDIPFFVRQNCPSNCAPSTELILCDTLSTLLVCDPDPCLDPMCMDLPAMSPPSLTRRTLGFSDRVARTRITDPADVPSDNLTRATLCDTVGMSSTVSYCGMGSADNLFLELSYTAYADGQRALLDQQLNYRYRAADGTVTTGTTAPTTDAIIDGDHVLQYDLGAVIPGGTFATGDSLTYDVEYYIPFELKNNLSETLETIPNLQSEVFTLDDPSGDPLPGGAMRNSCGAYPIDFFLHEVFIGRTGGNTFTSSCDPFSAQRDFRGRSGANFDYYVDEVRPITIVDSITVAYGNFYREDGMEPQVLLRAASPGFAQTFTLTDTLSISADGRTVTYDARSLPLPDFFSTGVGEYLLTLDLQANCEATNAIATIFHYRQYAQTAAPACDSDSRNTGRTIALFPPRLTLNNTTGPIVGDEEVECFDYEIILDGPNTPPNIILFSEEEDSPLELVRVTDLATGDSPPVLPYDGGGYVELYEDLAIGTYEVEVCVTAGECVPNAMLNIGLAYDCDGFMNPDSLQGRCLQDSDPLELLPREAAIQVDFRTQPSNPVELCQPLVYEARFNSSQTGNVIDPVVSVDVPDGMELTMAEVEYPINSGDFETITLTNTTGIVTIVLGDHSAINDSLPGTGAADIATFPAGEDRQALVRLSFLSSCEFASGDRVVVTPSGDSPCGGPARGSGDRSRSNSILIDGVNTPYTVDVDLDLGVDSIFSCEPQTVAFQFTFFDGTPGDGETSTVSTTSDSIEVFLPAGAQIVPGSYMCTAGLNCPGVARTDDERNLVVLAYPTDGIEISDGGSAVIDISFAVVAGGGDVACNETNQFGARAVNYIAGVACATEPNNVCDEEVRSIVDQADTTVAIRRAQLLNLMVDAQSGSPGEYSYSGSFEVTEEIIPDGDELVIEVFCSDGAGGPMGARLGTSVVPGPLAIGDMPTFSGNVSGACGDALYFVIAPDTEAGEPQCVCVPEAATVEARQIMCALSISDVMTDCTFDPVTEASTFTVDMTVTAVDAPAGDDLVISYNGTQVATVPADPSGTTVITGVELTGAMPMFNGTVAVNFATTPACRTSAPVDLIACTPACTNTPDEIGGNVFFDNNNDGEDAGANEVGQGNVLVQVYDCDEMLVCEVFTNEDGDWSCDGLTPGEDYRVEYSTPQSPQLTESFAGPDNGTNVQFVTAGMCDADYAVIDEDQLCRNQVLVLAVPCYEGGNYTGPNAGNPAAVSTSIDNSGTSPAPSSDANLSQVGASWGAAFNQRTDQLYFSSVLKRHSAFADGPGFIYQLDYTDPNNGMFVAGYDLQGVTPANRPGEPLNFGSVCRDAACAAALPGAESDYVLPSDPTDPSVDFDAFSKIGTISYGDIEYEPGTDLLWTVNLFERTLLSIESAGGAPGEVNAYDILSLPGVPTCTNGELRPWAVNFNRGVGYLGVVCDASASQDIADLMGFILRFNPRDPAAGFTVELEVPLQEPGSRGDFFQGDVNVEGDMIAWVDDINQYPQPYLDRLDEATDASDVQLRVGQPIISDIGFDGNDGLVVGILDRTTFQLGADQFAPILGSTQLTSAFNYGDIFYFCDNGDGTYTKEGSARGCVAPNQPPEGQDDVQFGAYNFGDDYFNLNGGDNSRDYAQGAFLILPETGEMVYTVTDPFPPELTIPVNTAPYIESQGLHWNSLSTGDRVDWYRIVDPNSSNGQYYGKGTGLGDLVGICGPAPIQIGNYAWVDTNNDGTQQACEDPLANLPVSLFDENGELVATTTTDANGNYYFSSQSADDPNLTWVGTGADTALVPNQDYTIVFGTDGMGNDVFDPQNGELTVGQSTFTITDTDMGSGGQPDENDSDLMTGTLANYQGFPSITLNTGTQTDHSFDAGFAPGCPVVELVDMTPPVCRTGEVVLAQLVDSVTVSDDFAYEWSTSGTGEFQAADGTVTSDYATATVYAPSAADGTAGEVTLTLSTTPATLPEGCEMSMDSVTVVIQNVDCGDFFWDGGE